MLNDLNHQILEICKRIRKDHTKKGRRGGGRNRVMHEREEGEVEECENFSPACVV